MRINLLLIFVMKPFPYLHIYCETPFHFMTWREDISGEILDTGLLNKDGPGWMKIERIRRQRLTL